MSGCILGDSEAHTGGYYVDSQHLQTQGGWVYFLAVSPLPLPHWWESLTTYKIQMPRNSSFVIICASQAYSAGQKELPEHLRSKNVSTLTSTAPENSQEFPRLKTRSQSQDSTGQLPQPPALPVVPTKGKETSGKYQWASSQCGGSPVKISREGALQLLVGFCSP